MARNSLFNKSGPESGGLAGDIVGRGAGSFGTEGYDEAGVASEHSEQFIGSNGNEVTYRKTLCHSIVRISKEDSDICERHRR